MKQITSSQNPFIKSLVILQEKAKARKETGTFLIEGLREIELAIKGNYEIETIVFLSELVSENQLKKMPTVNIIEISKEVYQKLAYRNTINGFFGSFKSDNANSLVLATAKMPSVVLR